MEYENHIGDVIEIVYMEGEPSYTNRVGTIKSIDDFGQLHGDWGSLAIIPEKDVYKTISKNNRSSK